MIDEQEERGNSMFDRTWQWNWIPFLVKRTDNAHKVDLERTARRRFKRQSQSIDVANTDDVVEE